MWSHMSGTMARLTAALALIVLLAIGISAVPGKRMRRGFNNSGYSGGTGSYGRGSDERDNSSSQEGGNGCSSENGRSYSGSRELAYNRDGRQSNENRGSRSFAKSSASAAATSFKENQNSRNIII